MGVGAWLLGVGAATAGSLLAVSLLGQGIAPATSQQLSAATVTQALANETDEPTPQTASLPARTRSAAHRHKTQPSATPPPQTAGNPSAGPAPAGPADAASAWPTSVPAPVMPTSTRSASTMLSSQGGTVVAECQSAGVYLVSWSPAQGYEADTVVRGPAATAKVTFESNANSVTMAVSCATGVPTASTTVGEGGGGGGGPDT